MVTIEQLEVHFDVNADGDGKVFADYFARLSRDWSRAHEQEQRQRQRLRRDQLLGDTHQDGDD